MIKHGWHATKNAEEIDALGIVKPARMSCVYLLDTLEAAAKYAWHFQYEKVYEVTYNSHNVAGSWKPAYAKGGRVIRLKPGATASVYSSEEAER